MMFTHHVLVPTERWQLVLRACRVPSPDVVVLVLQAKWHRPRPTLPCKIPSRTEGDATLKDGQI